MQQITLRILILAFSLSHFLIAQPPGGKPGGGSFDPAKMNIGRLYGKVVDEEGNALAYANVQLMGKVFNPQTRSLKDTLLAGQFTQGNGDFNLEQLPIIGEFELIFSFLGFARDTQQVDFGMKRPADPSGGGQRPAGPPSGGLAGMGGASFEKDLGKIVLVAKAVSMEEVSITSRASTTTLALDRKIFRVDQDLTTAGGTAQDALRNVPSLSVDLNGNVGLRNGSPQIFIDGRPSTLSLDQISAAEIERIEVITNPSAKFDAGGGTAGIVNIVLKQQRRLGYNGNVRLGGDSRLGNNLGLDANLRQGKINVFASGGYNAIRSVTQANTYRQNLDTEPLSAFRQTSMDTMQGLFVRGRAGIDFLIDNHNTLTLSGSYFRGAFRPRQTIDNRSEQWFPGDTLASAYERTSEQDRSFRNMGASLQFKHLFTQPGGEWTADVNYNQVRFLGESNFGTLYDNGLTSQERQEVTGAGSFFTAQTDLIYPLGEQIKLEAGLKTILRSNQNENQNAVFRQDEWQPFSQLSDRYAYQDNIYAAYVQSGYNAGQWGVQAGLRAESSFYTGTLTEIDSSFEINYPINLFPSVFLTRNLGDGGDQLQLAYTRRVKRPNFFQTLPYTDYTDSLNLRRGNIQLLPEFSNSVELTYQNLLGKNHNLLVSLYYKQASNLIAAYQFNEYDAVLDREVVITSYANAEQAYAYGGEVTLKNSFFGWLDLTTNVNVYQAQVNATNVESNLRIDQLSAFVKETIQLKLPKDFALQLNGEYRSRASFTPSNNNEAFGPGASVANSAQGYNLPVWFVDASLRKGFWNNKGSLTLSVQDIFASRREGSYTATDFFIQETDRIRNPQLIRLNFSYRFGKMDMSLFKRKNNRMNMQGNDMM
jgi:outer membrane receptor protein involved in Fe transport